MSAVIPEAASKLSYNFLVGFFAPAALFVGGVTFYLEWVPTVSTGGQTSIDFPVLAGTLFAVSAAFAILLQTFNPFLIKVCEGASGCPSWAARPARKRKADQLRLLTTRIDRLKAEDTPASLDEAYRLERERFLRFPSRAEDVLPTELGNAIAAWEHYPYRRYGIDAITLWPRLAPLLSKEVSDAIASSKARFDLLFNLFILIPSFGLLRATILADSSGDWRRWVWFLLSLGAGLAVWKLAVAAAAGWGDTVKAAFDLHRLDVLKQMGVADSATRWTSEQEKLIWRETLWPMKFDYTPSLRVAPRRGNAKSAGASTTVSDRDEGE